MVSARRPKSSNQRGSSGSSDLSATRHGEQAKQARKQPSQELGRRVNVRIVTFLLLLIAYLIWFYRGEFTENVARAQALLWLLVPDQIVWEGWLGGEIGRFRLTDRLPIFGVALVIWVAAVALGRILMQVGRLDVRLTRLESFLFAIGMGLSGWSLYTLAIGLGGGLQQPLLFVVPAVVVVIAAAILGRGSSHGDRGGKNLLLAEGVAPAEARPAIERAESTTPHVTERVGTLAGSSEDADAPPQLWGLRWWWLGVPFVVVLMLSAALPPSAFDVLEYHLQVPKEWYQQGQVTFLPHNIYGNMPLGAEMLASLAMVFMPGPLDWWWGALAGKVVLAGFAPLTALMLYAAGTRWASKTAGAVAALLCISTPWIAVVSVHGLIDGVLAFYLLASFYAFKLWHDAERDAAARHDKSFAVLTGFMAGSAIACKYTGVLFVAVPLAAGVVWIGIRCRWRLPTWSSMTVLFLMAVIAGSGLWLGKNWALSGNPTYPLLYQAFGGLTRTPVKDQQWRTAHQVPRNQDGEIYSLSQAADSLANVLGRSRWHHPLIIPLAALVFCRRRPWQQAGYWLAAVGYLVVMWWLLTHRIDRFWVPALPLMALVAGIGATWSMSRLWRMLLWSILLMALLVNFLLIASSFPGPNPLLVSLEQLRDDPRLTWSLPAHQYLNQHLNRSDRVLLVGDACPFDLRVPVLYNTCFDDHVFEQIFRDRDRAERLARLRALGVTHLFVDWSEIRRYRDTYGFTDYVTRELLYDQLVGEQKILRRVPVPSLDSEQGDLFEVIPAAEY